LANTDRFNNSLLYSQNSRTQTQLECATVQLYEKVIKLNITVQ